MLVQQRAVENGRVDTTTVLLSIVSARARRRCHGMSPSPSAEASVSCQAPDTPEAGVSSTAAASARNGTLVACAPNKVRRQPSARPHRAAKKSATPKHPAARPPAIIDSPPTWARRYQRRRQLTVMMRTMRSSRPRRKVFMARFWAPVTLPVCAPVSLHRRHPVASRPAPKSGRRSPVSD